MPSLQTDYHVEKGQVTLSVVIGNAQLGSSLVKVDKKEITRGDDIANCPIGNGSGIKGKALVIKTVVTDVNDKTNYTSVTYQLKGGVRDVEYCLDGTVAQQGDSIVYRAIFNLV